MAEVPKDPTRELYLFFYLNEGKLRNESLGIFPAVYDIPFLGALACLLSVY
jgi:hypothetical protein